MHAIPAKLRIRAIKLTFRIATAGLHATAARQLPPTSQRRLAQLQYVPQGCQGLQFAVTSYHSFSWQATPIVYGKVVISNPNNFAIPLSNVKVQVSGAGGGSGCTLACRPPALRRQCLRLLYMSAAPSCATCCTAHTTHHWRSRAAGLPSAPQCVPAVFACAGCCLTPRLLRQ
jgi:hypothetical protein